MDPDRAFRRPATGQEQADGGGGLFAPNVEAPAPSAPGSSTSEDAADAVTRGPFRKMSYRKIIRYLETMYRPLSMHEISVATGIPINVVCARLAQGELRPLWVATYPRACKSHANPTLHVDGFMLTPACRERLTREITP